MTHTCERELPNATCIQISATLVHSLLRKWGKKNVGVWASRKSKIHHLRWCKKLKCLKKCKSPGPDLIHPRLLRELANTLSLPLKLLCQKSLEEGKLPDDWKEAHGTPLHKKGNRKTVSNYQPISLTSVVCKVLESIIRDIITNHMSNNNLWHPDQHGFLQGRSCVTQLLQVIDEWSKSLDKGLPQTAVYLDFAKAFDTVPTSVYCTN